jgi:sterol desaturase/sphingolipid hydroxylase (fatty acid hydroxylase superfamily)
MYQSAINKIMETKFLDFFRLTKTEYFADFFITLPLTMVLAWFSMRESFGWLWIAELISGMFLWTLYEYIIHRWVSHGIPIFKEAHALHHDNPKDYIAIPPWATLLSYLAFWLVLGFNSSAFMVGFSTGYIIYSALHSSFHYYQFKSSSMLRGALSRHILHHRYNDAFYGVSTGLWDRVFKTNKPSHQN